jgi:hypothetical protein
MTEFNHLLNKIKNRLKDNTGLRYDEILGYIVNNLVIKTLDEAQIKQVELTKKTIADTIELWGYKEGRDDMQIENMKKRTNINIGVIILQKWYWKRASAHDIGPFYHLKDCGNEIYCKVNKVRLEKLYRLELLDNISEPTATLIEEQFEINYDDCIYLDDPEQYCYCDSR